MKGSLCKPAWVGAQRFSKGRRCKMRLLRRSEKNRPTFQSVDGVQAPAEGQAELSQLPSFVVVLANSGGAAGWDMSVGVHS